MVVEAHKVFKKRRLRRHRLSIDDIPEINVEVKRAPKPPPLPGVIDIFQFMSEKVEDYSDVIHAIGAAEKRRKKKQEEELARSKSCSDLLHGLVIPLDHSPRLKRRFSISANMCIATSEEPMDDFNKNQEEQKLLKENYKSMFIQERPESGGKSRIENPGHCSWDSRKSDPSIFRSPDESIIINNGDSRFSVSKVSEDRILEHRKSTG